MVQLVHLVHLRIARVAAFVGMVLAIAVSTHAQESDFFVRAMALSDPPGTARGAAYSYLPGFQSFSGRTVGQDYAGASASFRTLAANQSSRQLGGEPFVASASAWDTLTVSVPGRNDGYARVEMAWQFVGSLSSEEGTPGSVDFLSEYSTESLVFPAIHAGSVEISSLGIVDQLVTFVYDKIPIGSPWNIKTNLTVSSESLRNQVDFSTPSILVGAKVFVDDMQVAARVVGQSGAVYLVPEPASFALVFIVLSASVNRRKQIPKSLL